MREAIMSQYTTEEGFFVNVFDGPAQDCFLNIAGIK